MREAVYRLTAPLLARIPDYSRDPLQRQAAIGLGISVVVHLILFLLAAIALWLTPSIPGFENVDEPSLEIEIVPMREKAEKQVFEADEKKARELLMSKGMEASKEKPENPEFESDQDMKAGSELPATGTLPVPSQEGRKDLPGLSYAKQDVILGATDNAAASIFRAPKGNVPPPPIFKPQPLTQAQLDAANEAGPMTALPQVAATPPPRFEDRIRPAAPTPSRKVPKPAEGELAVTKIRPVAPAKVTKVEPERPREMVDAPVTRPAMATPPPQQMAALTPPQQSGQSKFQEFREKTQVEGAISNKGRPAVNAVGTPLGRYMRDMSMLIESRWQHLIQRDREWISVGSVRVRFTVMPDGTITGVTVEANDSSRRHADVCVEAIRETKLKPIPPEVTAALADGKLEIPFTFTLLP